jgi:hypothetical protein
MEPTGQTKPGAPAGGTIHLFKPLFVRALRNELPALVAEGVIDAAAAERLRERYQVPGEATGRRWALVVFSLLGALLIGSGSILLIAHNWESFTRPTRAVFSYALLAVGQSVVAWVLLTGKRELPWREGSGLFAQLAAGACFALISQTYHISDDVGTFLLAWMLMTLPLVYLLGAAAPAMVYLAGILLWAVEVQRYREASPAHWYWALLALALPFVVATVRRERHSMRSAWLLWTAGATALIGAGVVTLTFEKRLWVPLYGALAGVCYLAGKAIEGGEEESSLLRRPLTALGSAGATVIAFMLTFADIWEGLSRNSRAPLAAARGFWQGMIPTAIFMALALVLLGRVLARRERDRVLLGLLPVIAWGGWLLMVARPDRIALALPLALLFNAYTLLIGLWQLRAGIASLSPASLNRGLAVVAGLIVARFFDLDLGYVARGVAFIALGAAFLAANVVIARRRTGDRP